MIGPKVAPRLVRLAHRALKMGMDTLKERGLLLGTNPRGSEPG